MKCPRPFATATQPWVPCGMCLPCRINRQREWSARILIEAMSWPHSLFVTLTYSPENVPVLEDGTPTLWPGVKSTEGQPAIPGDLTLFWKRLRKRLGLSRLRYYAVGEYGDETWRPHYHAVVFGLSALDCTRVGRHLVHPDIQSAWGLGYTSAGELTPERAAYCAQYVTKKLTKLDDERTRKILAGRWPEFIRTSRRPGIGALHVPALAEALLHADPTAEDIPTEIVMPDGRRFGMPSFLAHKIREELGMERLASNRPAREREPPSGEYIEVVEHGLAGTITRRVPIEEQRAREAERKASRKRRYKKESMSHGKEEAEAFRPAGANSEGRRGSNKTSSTESGAPVRTCMDSQSPSSGRRVVGPPPPEENGARALRLWRRNVEKSREAAEEAARVAESQA